LALAFIPREGGFFEQYKEDDDFIPIGIEPIHGRIGEEVDKDRSFYYKKTHRWENDFLWTTFFRNIVLINLNLMLERLWNKY